jgi:hypothetical protein
MRLRKVTKVLIHDKYDGVAPAALLDRRTVDGNVEDLVQWRDAVEDLWVPDHLISDEVCPLGCQVACFSALVLKGCLAPSTRLVLDRRTEDGSMESLVQWRDAVEDSWAPAHLVSEEVCMPSKAARLLLP